MSLPEADAYHMARLDPEQLVRAEITALRAENTALRAEMAALRSGDIQCPQGEGTRATAVGIFDFLSLAPELRNAIYDACVVVGDVRVNCPGQIRYDDMRFRAFEATKNRSSVNTSVFAVNKQMRREALERYQFGNHFIVPATRQSFEVAASDIQRWRIFPGLYNVRPCFIRSLSISIDYRQWDGTRADYFDKWSDLDGAHYFTDASRPADDQRILDHHGAVINAFHEENGILIEKVLEKFSQLRMLQINVENAYCPSGCHHVASGVLEYLRAVGVPEDMASMRSSLPLETIDFLGTVDKTERTRIRREFPVAVALQDMITFHGELDYDEDDDNFVWDMSVKIHDTPPTDDVRY